MAEVATYLKVGVTALVLAMIEDDYFGDVDLTLAAPVQSLRKVSYDLTMSGQSELADGRSLTAPGRRWEVLALAGTYAESGGREVFGAAWERHVCDRWVDSA